MEAEQQALLRAGGVAQIPNQDEVQTQPAPTFTLDALDELRQGIQRDHEVKSYNSIQRPSLAFQYPERRHVQVIRDSSVSPAFQEVHFPAVTAPPPRMEKRLVQNEYGNRFHASIPVVSNAAALRQVWYYPGEDNDQLITPDVSADTSAQMSRGAEDEDEDEDQWGALRTYEYCPEPFDGVIDFQLPRPHGLEKLTDNPLPEGSLPTFNATPFYDEIAGKLDKKVGENQCPHCDKRYSRARNLEIHLLTHSQEKAFACDSCSTRFYRLHDLQRHRNLHTGGRLFACDKCDRKFARADALTRHKRTVCERTNKYFEGGDDMDFVGDAMKEHHAAATSGEERAQGALPSTDVDVEMEEETSPLSVSRKRNRGEEDEFMESISKVPRMDTPYRRVVDTESKVSSPKDHTRMPLELEQSLGGYVEAKKRINRRGQTVRVVHNHGRGTGGRSFPESANPYSSPGMPVDETLQKSPRPPPYLQRSDISSITEQSIAGLAREVRPNIVSQASIPHPMAESSPGTFMQETANQSQLHLSEPSLLDYNTERDIRQAQLASGVSGFSATPHTTIDPRLRRRRRQPSTSSFEGDREFQGHRRALTPENLSPISSQGYWSEDSASAPLLPTTASSIPRDPGTPSSTGGSGSSSGSQSGGLSPGTPDTSVSGGSGHGTPTAPTQSQSQHSQAGATNLAGSQTTGIPSPNPGPHDTALHLSWFKADSTTTLLIDILLLLAIAAQVTAIVIYIMSKPQKGDGRSLDPDFLTLVSNCLIQLAGIYITQRGMRLFTEAKDPHLRFNLCLVLTSSFVLSASALGLYFVYTTLGDSLMTLAGLLQVWSWKMIIYKKREGDDIRSASPAPSGGSNIPMLALPRGRSPCP